MSILHLLADPAAWAALATLIVMEIVLGIDNLVFISLLSNKLPEGQRVKVRRVGIGLALGLRLVLLSAIAWIAGLVEPVFDLGIAGAVDAHGVPSFETAFSVRDLALGDLRPAGRIVCVAVCVVVACACWLLVAGSSWLWVPASRARH